ncbi:Chloroperoxidase [Gorgonomyces haynaldii]|nr:Chloroperoxidase [Gorgonomyces haynaldii]
MLFTAVLALPQAQVGTYQAPLPGQIRSPCPAFNVLANHGYFPRDGSAIPRKQIIDQFESVLSVDPGLTKTLLDASILLNVGTKLPQTISLKDLRQHGNVLYIEHDASLFRNDANLGDNSAVNTTLLQNFLAASKDGKVVTIDDVADVRKARYADSKARNSKFFFGPKQELLAFGEAGLLVKVLDKNGEQPTLDLVKQFAGEERLPDGWTKSTTPVTSADVLAYAAKLKVKAGVFNS